MRKLVNATSIMVIFLTIFSMILLAIIGIKRTETVYASQQVEKETVIQIKETTTTEETTTHKLNKSIKQEIKNTETKAEEPTTEQYYEEQTTEEQIIVEYIAEPETLQEYTYYEEPEVYVQEETVEYYQDGEYSPSDFYADGVIFWGDWKYTYYSEQVLPGLGLNIPGRWSDGTFVRDQNGFLCVACNDLPYGSVVSTPFGDAIVYDAVGDGVTGLIDIYVSW